MCDSQYHFIVVAVKFQTFSPPAAAAASCYLLLLKTKMFHFFCLPTDPLFIFSTQSVFMMMTTQMLQIPFPMQTAKLIDGQLKVFFHTRVTLFSSFPRFYSSSILASPFIYTAAKNWKFQYCCVGWCYREHGRTNE